MGCQQRIAQAARQLADAGIVSAMLDARLLMQHVLGCDHAGLIQQAQHVLTSDEQTQFDALLARRLTREPLSHIVGVRAFWKDEFAVNASVLDPRADSETLIEAVLDEVPDRLARLRILDLGTGSGCLLLSLLREYPHATGVGVDISEAAARVAQRNANALGLSARADFMVARWTDALQSNFDVIMSNPPYIAQQDIAALEPEVNGYEPHLALSGGADGLDAYRCLIPQIALHLAPCAMAVVELGFGQGAQVAALAECARLRVKDIRNDLAGVPRAMMLKALQE